MKSALILLSLFVGASQVFAASDTFQIQTTTGSVVEVSEEALQTTYHAMVTLKYNATFKNEDGSTTIVRPAVMVAGELHTLSVMALDPSGPGICKLRGFTTLVSDEIEPSRSGPWVILHSDGTIYDTGPSPIEGLFSYRSVTCR